MSGGSERPAWGGKKKPEEKKGDRGRQMRMNGKTNERVE